MSNQSTRDRLASQVASARMNRRDLLLKTAAGAGMAALATANLGSLAGAQSATPASPAGGEIKMLIRKPTTLNPLFLTSGNEEQIARLIFGALIKMDDKLTPTADLAESFEGSPDAKTYTFKLRHGIVFNDGQLLTAKDVVFTFERAVDKRTGSPWRGRLLAIDGAEAYGDQKADSISGLATPDDLTIKLTLAKPDATFLLTLGNYSGLGILPEHKLKDIAPDQLSKQIFLEPSVGAGAFNFTKYETDQYIELDRNAAYTGGHKANLDRILLTIRTPEVALGDIQKGDLDIMRLAIADVDAASKIANVDVVSVTSPSMDQIGINVTRPYLSDKRVRQAMLYAIDRKTIVQTLLNGRGEVVNSPIFGPDWMGIPDGLNAYDYNPDTAKQLLKDAGWDASRKLEALTVPPNEEWWAQIVQQQLNDAGIKVGLVVVDVPTLITRLFGDTPDFDLFLTGGDTYRADPNISSEFFGTDQIPPAGGNAYRYSNPALDALYVQGRATNDVTVRKQIYAKAAKILNEDVPSLFLWSPNAFFAVNKRVVGFKGPGYVDNRLWNADEWSVKS